MQCKRRNLGFCRKNFGRTLVGWSIHPVLVVMIVPFVLMMCQAVSGRVLFGLGKHQDVGRFLGLGIFASDTRSNQISKRRPHVLKKGVAWIGTHTLEETLVDVTALRQQSWNQKKSRHINVSALPSARYPSQK
jgi:hypothetical protein